MAEQHQVRRGTTAELSTFVGAVGEHGYDTDKKTLVMFDGATAGGIPMAREDAQPLEFKKPVRATTTANITLSGEQTIDGVAVVAGDRVLVGNQSTASENGIYVVATGAWSRSSDFDADADVVSALIVAAEEGTANADSLWMLTTDGAITLGTTALTFAEITGLHRVTAGDGLAKAGNTLALDIAALTAMTGPATGDAVPIEDVSIPGRRKVTLANLLKVIDGLAQDASPDGAADFVASFDASTGLAKKVLMDDLPGTGGGGSSIDFKDSIRVATTANITLSGEQTIDGVAVVTNDRVLVKDQTTASENGIYDVAAGAWTRASDMNADAEATPGLLVAVEEGTANADSLWMLTTDGAITLGTTALTFAEITGLYRVTVGAGLTKTGNTIDIDEPFEAADRTKLDGIETAATADQNDAEIKTAYENNANTNEFDDAEQTKLAGIETAAKDDQTGAEIKTAYEGEADTNAYSDSEKTKLSGIEIAADQTDTSNVAAAGAGMLGTAQEWTRAQNFNATALTDGANIAWNAEQNQVASVTLGGNRTLDNPTNMKDGATYILIVKQDATGSRTLAYGTAYKFENGAAPILTTAVNAVDILTFVSDGTSMFGVAQKDLK